MRKFDTKVQHLKYKVLREVAREAWAGRLAQTALDIPKTIVPGKVPTMRCCIYKERAILAERVKIAMGGDQNNPNVIEVIDIACNECPVGGYEPTGVRMYVVLEPSLLTTIMWRISTKASVRSAVPAQRSAPTVRSGTTSVPVRPPAKWGLSPWVMRNRPVLTIPNVFPAVPACSSAPSVRLWINPLL